MKPPNIVINVMGDHPTKTLVSAMITNYLSSCGVNASHLTFDRQMLEEMTLAVNESKENKLSEAVVLVADWDELVVDETYNPEKIEETNNEQREPNTAD